MKNIITLVTVLLGTLSTHAQPPVTMNYQTLVKDANSKTLVNQTVGIKISVLKGAETGPSVYVETKTQTTNANGLVTLKIGDGTVVSGDMKAIEWSKFNYWIKTETDPTGGGNYTLTRTSKFSSTGTNGELEESFGDIEYVWLNKTCNLAVGDAHAGGIIFYLDKSGCHGLVVKEKDEKGTERYTKPKYAWSIMNKYFKTDAAGSGEGEGAHNTRKIISKARDFKIENLGHLLVYEGYLSKTPAATVCDELSYKGYSDWYLPSKQELVWVYNNLWKSKYKAGRKGSFYKKEYWSSTENDEDSAYVVMFYEPGGGTLIYKKGIRCSVRAIRAF